MVNIPNNLILIAFRSKNLRKSITISFHFLRLQNTDTLQSSAIQKSCGNCDISDRPCFADAIRSKTPPWLITGNIFDLYISPFSIGPVTETSKYQDAIQMFYCIRHNTFGTGTNLRWSSFQRGQWMRAPERRDVPPICSVLLIEKRWRGGLGKLAGLSNVCGIYWIHHHNGRCMGLLLIRLRDFSLTVCWLCT